MIKFGKELGFFELKDVPISIDECPGEGFHKTSVPSIFNFGSVAHTHCCKSDPCFKLICAPEWGIKSTLVENAPSVLLWHEYGHYLDPTILNSCDDHSFKEHLTEEEADSIIQRKLHGPSFETIMNNLGKFELARQTIPFELIDFNTPGW